MRSVGVLHPHCPRELQQWTALPKHFVVHDPRLQPPDAEASAELEHRPATHDPPDVVQSWHVPAKVPHAVSDVPPWQVPVESQQPLHDGGQATAPEPASSPGDVAPSSLMAASSPPVAVPPPLPLPPDVLWVDGLEADPPPDAELPAPTKLPPSSSKPASGWELWAQAASKAPRARGNLTFIGRLRW
jgi:hypothetical protein